MKDLNLGALTVAYFAGIFTTVILFSIFAAADRGERIAGVKK